jgi:membrane protein
MTEPDRERQLAASSSSDGERRGREATGVSEIPARGWKDILRRTWDEVTNDHVLLIGAGVTFYALLALVPALTALVSIYGLFADPATLEQHVSQLQGIVPEGGLSVLREQLGRLAAQGETKLGLTSVVSLAIALWSANSGMKALIEAMNVVYDRPERRSFLKVTWLSVLMTLAFLAFMAMAANIMLLPEISAWAKAVWGERLLAYRWLLLTVAVLILISALYYFAPCGRQSRFHIMTAGATLAASLWILLSMLFSLYLTNFANYSVTYGSLGAAAIFMTWLWLTITTLLVGAEVDAAVESLGEPEDDVLEGSEA